MEPNGEIHARIEEVLKTDAVVERFPRFTLNIDTFRRPLWPFTISMSGVALFTGVLGLTAQNFFGYEGYIFPVFQNLLLVAAWFPVVLRVMKWREALRRFLTERRGKYLLRRTSLWFFAKRLGPLWITSDRSFPNLSDFVAWFYSEPNSDPSEKRVEEKKKVSGVYLRRS